MLLAVHKIPGVHTLHIYIPAVYQLSGVHSAYSTSIYISLQYTSYLEFIQYIYIYIYILPVHQIPGVHTHEVLILITLCTQYKTSLHTLYLLETMPGRMNAVGRKCSPVPGFILLILLSSCQDYVLNLLIQ